MSTANETIAHSLTVSRQLFRRFVEDLKPEEYLHRVVPKANCVAWILGHLTLTERRALGALGVDPARLPKLPEGFEKRFARDETAPQSGDYGDVSILLPLWDQHRQLLIDTVKTAPPEQLGRKVEQPRPFFSTVGEMVSFMAIHGTMHAGQITIIRRSLGRPPVV